MSERRLKGGGEEAAAGIRRPVEKVRPTDGAVVAVDDASHATFACIDGERGAVIGFDLLLPDAPQGYWDENSNQKDAWYRVICVHNVFITGIFDGLLSFDQMDEMTPPELHYVFYNELLPPAVRHGVLSEDVVPFLLADDAINWSAFLSHFHFLLQRTAEASVRLGLCGDIAHLGDEACARINIASPFSRPTGGASGNLDADDPELPQLLRTLRDFAVGFGRNYMREHPDCGVVVAGAHSFHTTPERMREVDGVCLEDLETGELIVPMAWVATKDGLQCDPRFSSAIEPKLLERFRRDALAAANSSEPIDALRRLAEDPLRYMTEVA